MKPYTYLLIDLGCILVPFIASFYPKHAFYKEWKYFFPANIIVAIIFLIWDYLFTDMGVWGFNPDYLTGIYLGNLPLEEVLFFICIPYACTFTYFALQFLIKRNPVQKNEHVISSFLVLGSLLIGFANYDHWYTATTFFSLASWVMISIYFKVDQSHAYLAYALILPFFFISNGLLTGSVVDAPIVWYNDHENLGLRMFTIPFEDTFYGLLLILMNINIYDHIKRKKLPSLKLAQ